MSIETAGGAAAIKFFGVAVLASALGTAVGFALMWPRTAREAVVRFTCAISSSITFGPLLAIGAHSWWPSYFTSAGQVGAMYGGDAMAGLLAAAAPFLVIAALPAWWLLGGLVLWLERRRGKDIGEIAHDAVDVVKTVKEGLL
ncbi:hypothetical protein E7V67_011615 [[Empedobacter] haloabium]|uniref:Uncharacterized protein n=1 Tax=[Empedobacter] haloabium TaxID=592317 RepID=A0ABZ1USL6_9BURK